MKSICLLPLVLILLLAACGGGDVPPVVDSPPTNEPGVPSTTPVGPDAVPYAGEWRVSFVSSETSETFTYAVNVTRESTYNGATYGSGYAIACQTSTVCDYVNGATTSGYGSVGDFRYESGRLALSASILDGETFFSGDDTDGVATKDSQGRQVVEGAGYLSLSPGSGNLTRGYVSATRLGEARVLQPAPTDSEPTPPTDPIPPADPEPTPPADPAPPIDPEPTPQPPTINSFTASSRSIETGDTVTLRWDVDNAESLSISPNVGDVTGSDITVRPDETTKYTLTATNSGGSNRASVSITVADPEPPAPQEAALRYWVNSDCGRVSTTYATVDGGTAQRDFGNGYVYTVDSGVRSDTFLYISAQNQCDRGDVTVRIYKRGNIYKETSSSGAYVIATASGSY